jgi:two-component system sensor histidine kinase/response regulator
MKSLKNRIIVSLLSIFLIGLWSLSWYLSTALNDEMEQLLGTQQAHTIGIFAEELDHELAGRINDLETIARTVTPSMLQSGGLAQQFLESRPVLSNRFNAGVFISNHEGVAIASLPKSLDRVGTSYLDRDYVKRAIQEGKSTVGEPVIGKRVGAPVVGLAVPIRNAQGAIVGALAGVIDLAASSFLDRIGTRRIGKTGGYLLIAPQSRLIVTASDKSRVMERLATRGTHPMTDSLLSAEGGWALMTTPEGVEVLAAKKTYTYQWVDCCVHVSNSRGFCAGTLNSTTFVLGLHATHSGCRWTGLVDFAPTPAAAVSHCRSHPPHG